MAAEYLSSRGLRILCTNFRSRQGEIDIVAKEGLTVVFCEVKYRRNRGLGLPSEAVNRKKQRIICRVADFYRCRYALPDNTDYRFDVISILDNEISWYKNAFEYQV
ncbi:MAG: YraN family protein [Lachnospiraceae bacterium]|nr:YraN family protein [Lachnospiraceae bacterium]